MDLELTCVSCGKRFFARRADARACSQACRTRLSRARRAEGGLHPDPSVVGAAVEGGAAASPARRASSARPAASEGAATGRGKPAPAAAIDVEAPSSKPLSAEVAASAAGLSPDRLPLDVDGGMPAQDGGVRAEVSAAPGAGALAGLDRDELFRLGLSASLAEVVAEEPKVRVAMKFLSATTRAVGALAAQQLGAAAADPLVLEGAPAGDALVGWLLVRVRDRALWETLLQRGDQTVRELFVALAQVEVEKGRVALKVGPGNAQLEGVLAVERLLAADPALRAAVAAARGAALISVRMALSVRARGLEVVGDGAAGGAGAAGVGVGAGEGGGAPAVGVGRVGAGLGGVMPSDGLRAEPEEWRLQGRGSSIGAAGAGLGGVVSADVVRSTPQAVSGAADLVRGASAASGALGRGGAATPDAPGGAAMLELARLRAEMGGLRTELVRSQSEVATLRVAVERLNEVVARRAVEVSELRGVVELQRVELGYLRTTWVGVLEGMGAVLPGHQ